MGRMWEDEKKYRKMGRIFSRLKKRSEGKICECVRYDAMIGCHDMLKQIKNALSLFLTEFLFAFKSS
jgi:hypothetical protein